MVVPKSNGNIRIFVDFKVTINGWLRTDHYPLPNPEDIFAKIAGSKVFSKVRSDGCIESVESRQRFSGTIDCEYTQRIVQICKTSFWNHKFTKPIPEYHG